MAKETRVMNERMAAATAPTGDEPPEVPFERVFNGRTLTFSPTGADAAHIRRDDEEIVWLALCFEERRTDAVLRLPRGASPEAVVQAYIDERKLRGLAPSVRLLREAAILIYGSDWQPHAARDLQVEEMEIVRLLDGHPPPAWLDERLKGLKPRLAFAAKRYARLARMSSNILESLGGYDDAAASYPTPLSGPDGF